MATHVMKIRPHFIASIRKGTKKHEYRLGDAARCKIKTGDILVLVSNQDASDYVRVKVDSSARFSNWDEALDGRWKSDFYGIYSSYADLIKECHRFYSAEQVRQCGIIVFAIKPEKVQYKNARYLVDTNIIIHRESQDASMPLVGWLYSWLDKMNGKKLYHPASIDEIRKYQDKKVVESFSDKLNAYEKLVPVSRRDAFFESTVSEDPEDENTRIDNELLLQVYEGRTDFLLTDDKAILRKAERLYLRDRVLSPEDFLRVMEHLNPKLVDYQVLSIKKEKIGTLDVDDPFFDTLREDYGHADFNAWLNKKSGEEAYIFKDKDGTLQGFLYLKAEHPGEPFADFDKPMKSQEWLKVGTFKNATKGLRVGERFLKIIFDNAIAMNVDGIYVTLFENKREGVIRLMELMKQWGFVPYCHSGTGELVMVKDMRNYDKTKSPMFNYPLLAPEHGHFFLPIEPQWHGKLFPDLHLHNEDMSIYEREPCSYAVEKIYVCGWSRIAAKPGDLVFIYRKGEYWPKKYSSVVSGVAILQEILYPESEEQYLKLVKNKSVFTINELKSFYSKYRTVVKLLFLRPFEKKVSLGKLAEFGIVDPFSGPRINTSITPVQAEKIIKEGEKQ